ncbi:hypothetical protein HYZ78_01910 [Candidatus Microgenomates bacterium]|nr:hypothetical protein [Candidatus Microgenomates bacterium]
MPILKGQALLIAFPAHAQEPEPTPEVVGTIPLEDKEPDVYSREIIESIPVNAQPEVGVKENQLQFPNFEELTNTVDRAMPFLLPASLLEDLTKREDLEKKLKGKIFHPVCSIKDQKPDKKITEKESNIGAPEWWPVALSRTKLAQAIGVPGFSSWVEFQTAEGEENKFGETENDPIDCKTVLAAEDNQAKPETSQNVSKVFPNFLSWIQDLINLITDRFTPHVTVVIHPKKFLQGETEFAKQAGKEEGFLRAFAPQELLPEKEKFDGEVDTPYEKPGVNSTNINFQGVAGARVGYERLQQSLYPAELQGVIVPNPGGAPYPYPGGSDKLDYTIPYMDANVTISEEMKERIIGDVLKSWPNSRIRELWDQIVAQSRAAGVNPAFTITIWIEESGAGGVRANSQFGCFPGGNTSQQVPFDQSLSCFLNFTSQEHPNNFPEWVRYFCGPNANPICSNNPGFINRLRQVWARTSQ